jgi:pimeloyl-ACP methyl ester carboxylesterase
MNTTAEIKLSNRIAGPAGSLYVEDQGSGDIPLVFAHSFLGSTMHWKNQLDFLSKTRRAVAFDFRSHGNSERASTNDYSAEALSADIAAVVDTLDIDKFILVGHSMGGAAAIAYAGSNPQRVVGLVLSGTPGKSDEKQASAIIGSLESDAYQQVMDQYMEQLLANAKEEVNTLVRKDMQKVSREISVSIIKALFRFDPLPVLMQYKEPVLIISTAHEHQQPTSLHNQLPHIPHKEFQGTSHWTQLDMPEAFNKILEEFVKTVEHK